MRDKIAAMLDREPVGVIDDHGLERLASGEVHGATVFDPSFKDEANYHLFLHPPTGGEVAAAMDRIEEELTDLYNHDEMGGTARYLLSVLHGETRTMRECAGIPKDATEGVEDV